MGFAWKQIGWTASLVAVVGMQSSLCGCHASAMAATGLVVRANRSVTAPGRHLPSGNDCTYVGGWMLAMPRSMNFM